MQHKLFYFSNLFVCYFYVLLLNKESSEENT